MTREQYNVLSRHGLNYGMCKKDTEKLYAMLSFKCSNSSNIPTVREYLERYPNTKTEYRISRKGIKLIKVYFENCVREYELSKIDRIAVYNI